MRVFIFILSCLVCNISFCQDFDLQDDNQKYIAALDSCKSISAKINLIRDKVKRDRVLIAVPDYYGCKMAGHSFNYTSFSNNWKDKNGNKVGKKIIHAIFYKKGKMMLYLEERINPNCFEIFNFLTDKNIDKITIFTTGESGAIFGGIGSETRSVVIYTNDRKIKKLIKRLSK